MLLGLAAYLYLSYANGPTLAQLESLAKSRDVEGLEKLVQPLPEGVPNPFQVIRTGGAYDVGRYGWHAYEVDKYIVIGTPLTSEDVGEIVLRRSGAKLVYVPESDALGTRILHHRFDVRFDIPKKHAFIVDTASLAFEDSAPAEVLLRMSAAYKVSNITDETGASLKFHQVSGVVALMRPMRKKAELKITYDATVNLPMYAGSISDVEATLVNDYWYPMVARQPATYEITVHSPKKWMTVAQGEKLEERETDAERVTRYRMDLPVVYFSVISAPFNVVSNTIGGRKYTVWSARMTPAQMQVQTELYAGILDFYASHFRDTPYPFYGAVDSKTYGGGALEAYTFATYGGGLPAEEAHEPAHTWWGGWINNTYLHSFWNESFAVFSDGLYHREVAIGNPEERRLAFISDGRSEPNFSAASLVRSGAEVGPVGSSLGYGKGAKVLQMLSQAFGTDTVVKAMHTWVTTHPKGEPGEWEDFERVFLSVCSDDRAKGFFADWLHRPGFVDFDADVSAKEGGASIHLKWKSERFRMPLTVLLEGDGQSRYETLWLDGKKDDFQIPFEGKLSLVSIDPWRQAVRPVAENEEPVSLERVIGSLQKVIDPQHSDWLPIEGRGQAPSAAFDPAGKFLVGSPETWPALKPLCDKVGFEVHGNQLTYKGTTIDLTHGSALAVVDLDGGKQCVIGLGKARQAPDFGRTRLILTDDLGRLLRGVTDPKRTGKLTYRF